MDIKYPKICILVHLSVKFPSVLRCIIRLTRNDHWVNDFAAQYHVWSRFQISYNVLYSMSKFLNHYQQQKCHTFFFPQSSTMSERDLLDIHDQWCDQILCEVEMIDFHFRQSSIQISPSERSITQLNYSLKDIHDIDNTWNSSTRWYFTTFFFDTSWKHIFCISPLESVRHSFIKNPDSKYSAFIFEQHDLNYNYFIIFPKSNVTSNTSSSFSPKGLFSITLYLSFT